MVEDGAERIESEGREEDGPKDQIGRWIEVLDRWVKDLDRGLGRNGADTTSEPAVEDLDADS
jgi:hypothetical protein